MGTGNVGSVPLGIGFNQNEGFTPEDGGAGPYFDKLLPDMTPFS